MDNDKLFWILAAVCFGLGALHGLFAGKAGTAVNRIEWMLAGFCFVALTFAF